MAAEDAPGFTDDALLDGAIRLRQPSGGYRAGLDAMLLAAALETAPGMRCLEAGCGVGAALLAAAWRAPGARFVGVEREPEMAALARDNVARNGFAARVEVIEGDLFGALPTLAPFDLVFVNPPYEDRAERGRPPAPARRHAYRTEHALEAWVGALANRLTGGGVLTMIHRADRLDALLAAFAGRLGGLEILPIRPHPRAAARRVLARARKGSRAPVTLWPGLDLHDAPGGAYTAVADAILRGRTALAWEPSP